MSPAEALMGKKLIIPGLLSIPLDIDFPNQDLQANLEESNFDANPGRISAYHEQEFAQMQESETLLLENIKKAQAIQSQKSFTVKKRRAGHKATQPLPQIGEYALLRINNPPKLGKQFEKGVYKVVDFNAAMTVVQMEDSNGIRWCESTDNIKKYP
ncbi:g6097 [Coccomyxa elongata]